MLVAMQSYIDEFCDFIRFQGSPDMYPQMSSGHLQVSIYRQNMLIAGIIAACVVFFIVAPQPDSLTGAWLLSGPPASNWDRIRPL